MARHKREEVEHKVKVNIRRAFYVEKWWWREVQNWSNQI